MEDGIERSMPFLLDESPPKKQIIIVKPDPVHIPNQETSKKQASTYDEQVHPIGLSLISPSTNTNSGSSQCISKPTHQSTTTHTQNE